MTDEELQVRRNALPHAFRQQLSCPDTGTFRSTYNRATSRALPLTQEMIDEADRDGDGEIGEEEFMRIMKKTNLF